MISIPKGSEQKWNSSDKAVSEIEKYFWNLEYQMLTTLWHCGSSQEMSAFH